MTRDEFVAKWESRLIPALGEASRETRTDFRWDLDQLLADLSHVPLPRDRALLHEVTDRLFGSRDAAQRRRAQASAEEPDA